MPDDDDQITDARRQAAAALLAGRTELRLLAAMSPQQPTGLIRAVLAQARRADIAVTLMFADLTGRFAFLDDGSARDIAEGRLRLLPLAGAIARGYGNSVDYLPVSLGEIDRMLRRGGLRADAVLLRARRGPVPGQYSYGDMVGYTEAALARDAAAVVELDETSDPLRHPATQTLRASRADIVLAAPTAPAPAAPLALSPAQLAIGRHAAALLPDGATLQLGLGAVAEAVLRHLDGKRHLGVHSGIITPSLGRLIAAGVITGQAKSADPGLVVATGIHGPETAEGGLARAATAFRPVSETHDPQALARQARLWAVNSALEVDLTGQANAEFAGGARAASGGGQVDFARAAHLSEGGGSVIALPSVTAQGRSRIVAALPERVPPTSAAQDVDFVVTEYGVADLRGRTVRERALALAAIAHPSARAALLADPDRLQDRKEATP